MIEIDYKKLHKEKVLDSFITDLQELSAKQQGTIDKFKDREVLEPIVKNLQKKVDRWQTMIVTAEAFQKKFRADKK